MPFKYLGRYFNFQVDNSDHILILLDTIKYLMLKSDFLLLLYHRFVLSKLSWHFNIADLSKTWVVENLDSVVSRFVRQ